MSGPAAVFIAFIIVGLPTILLALLVSRWFRLKEKRLEIDAALTAEKAAQYASRSHELEDRVRVLEQIVTDSGAQTAAQIEALRDKPRIKSGDQVR